MELDDDDVAHVVFAVYVAFAASGEWVAERLGKGEGRRGEQGVAR